MKTVSEICQPREDVRTGVIKESDFAADLAQVLNGTAPAQYADSATFFANTYPTKGLRALLKNDDAERDKTLIPGAVWQFDKARRLGLSAPR